MKFRLDCRLPFPADLFWSIRATPGFMNFVVEDGLLRAMTGTTSTPAADARALDGDIRTRQQTYTPARVEMPDLVRGIVGQTLFEVTDTQTWNASPGAPTVQAFRITPSFLSSLCTTAGVLSVRPAPPPGAPDLGGEFAPPSPPVSLPWRRPAAVAVAGAAAGVSPARAADASGSEDGDASSREGAGGWSEYHSVATDDSDYASAVESAVGGPPAATAVSAASGSGWTSDVRPAEHVSVSVFMCGEGGGVYVGHLA
ncbi:hypothetical protein I4F81_012391 [Pyropia yezoensis]|uniref:Uncharacterized protein n=1 Tax=Pyropia yezoensis TaxID=2788 RepID=A0ACC3CI34_PYRYE|nr:hypothetical protein I4F81_012391 [Neopyropia yezoensis]